MKVFGNRMSSSRLPSMWGRADLIRTFVSFVAIASLWSLVHAQTGVEEKCNTCPVECIGSQCPRYLWTTMWGFVASLVALTVDAWGFSKSTGKDTIWILFSTFVIGALNPLLIIFELIEQGLESMAAHGEMKLKRVGMLNPWGKSSIKVVMGCDTVLVYLSPDVYDCEDVRQLTFMGTFVKHLRREGDRLSEALVIGAEVKDDHEHYVCLWTGGKLALLQLNLLPPYDKLKYVRGNDGLAMAIAGAQAVGYIYGVLVRCVQGLRLSPMEAIAFVLNIVVLMKVLLHNIVSLAHRPLVVYLSPDQERTFISKCQSIVSSSNFQQRWQLQAIAWNTAIVAIVSCPTVYFIINLKTYLHSSIVVPIILLQVSHVVDLILIVALLLIHFYSKSSRLQSALVVLIGVPIAFLNAVGYIWAIVVTFKYWKIEKFDTGTSNYLSQVLPYIG